MASTTASGRGKRQGRRPQEPEGRMSLGQHLIELRNRLFKAVIAVLVGAVGGWFLTPFVLDSLRSPVTQLARVGGHTAELNFPMITGAFDLRLQIAITIGVVIASPVWLYQIWAFIVPALVRREKQYVLGLPRHRDPAVLRRVRVRLVRPAARGRDPRQLRLRPGHLDRRREGLLRLRHQAHRRGRHRLRAAGVPGAAELRRRAVSGGDHPLLARGDRAHPASSPPS